MTFSIQIFLLLLAIKKKKLDNIKNVEHSICDKAREEKKKKEHWSGLPFPAAGDLPGPWIEPMSSALQAMLHHKPPWKAVDR